MRQASSSEADPDDSEFDFVEVDPSGRYGRYKEELGRGAFKKVYRAFDELEGIEVAWNQIKISELLRKFDNIDRLYSEVHLLQTLKHKNIIKFYSSWVDIDNEHINFITEIFTSGTLRQYRKKHKHVDVRALKKWSRQILEDLLYLHDHNPPIIHRDLKCDNIFVNGNHGEVKIGDLGLATILHQAREAHSVIGTPEFMAPELYEEEYNELVDIYAFGMCLLELVTLEYPYIECSNAAQIYRKVTSGIKPASLEKVTNADVKKFIEKCIANVSKRLSAGELLRDPFLCDTYNESNSRSLHPKVPQPDVIFNQSVIRTKSLDTVSGQSRDVTVQSERKDVNTIFIKLRIADSTGQFRNIHFPFDIEADTSIAVASEMVHELDLTDQDIPTIADMIEVEIRALIPDWSPRESFDGDSVDSQDSESKNEISPLQIYENNEASPMTNSSGNLRLERLPSGRKFWSDSPKGGVMGSPSSPSFPSPSNSSFLSPSNPSFLSSSDVRSETTGCLTASDKQLSGALGNSSSNERKINEHKSLTAENMIGSSHKSSGVVVSSKFAVDDIGCRQKCDTEKKDTQSNVNHVDPHKVGSMNEADSKCGLSIDPQSDALRKIAEKLDLLLAEHQEELDELKQRHEYAVADLLNGLRPENHIEVFKMCTMKIPNYKIHCGLSLYPGHVKKSTSFLSPLSGNVLNSLYGGSPLPVKRVYLRSASCIDASLSPNFFEVLTKFGSPKISTMEPSYQNNFNSFKNSFRRASASDLGIAVVLK